MSPSSADYYDAIYAFKNYVDEASRIAEYVRARCGRARTMLDAGCGTGEHARQLIERHGFEVDGIDLDARALDIARAKNPGRSFTRADMASFDLGRRFDAVICLFGSIGYLRSLGQLRRALRCFREHLADDGVVVLEPFLTPAEFTPGRTVVQTGQTGNASVERTCRTELVESLARLHFDFRVTDGAGARSFSEAHDLALFSRDELLSAFAAAGLAADFVPGGLDGRGVFIARHGSSPSTGADRPR